jgi:hypothetical protein
MLRSIKKLYGKALGTVEGEIGHVKDFYFNDQHWVVRYVIADTGSWLSGRLVLISPHAFGDFHQDGDCLLVNLTREQIETVRQLIRTSQSRDNMKRSIIVTMDGRSTGMDPAYGAWAGLHRPI